MDKSFVFRKPTTYNLSGKLKAILITLFTTYLARSKRNVKKYYSEKGSETHGRRATPSTTEHEGGIC